MRLRTLLCAALFFCASPTLAETEFVASTQNPKVVSLNPLRNGLSAITYTWAISNYAHNRVIALNAGLSTIVNGGTATLSAFEADTFREVNGINIGVSLENDDILLTMTAPHDAFDAALDHLHEILASATFSKEWYKRNLLQLSPVLASRNRRPSYLMTVLANHLMFPLQDDGTDTSDTAFRFGMPRQIILRTPNSSPDPLFKRAVQGLAQRTAPTLAQNKPKSGLTLPKGTIFVPDPNSNETLIFLAKAQSFDTPSDRIATNLLMDYMGAYQGSEMFRIIRQERRAAYDPRTEFRHLGKERGLLSLSATVTAEKWPEILAVMKDIYTNTRNGEVSKTGLQNNQRRLLNGYEYNFVTNPTWGARHFLAEYPNGSTGAIHLPLFQSLVNADLIYLRSATQTHLPPIDDYLLILIGGTLAPPPELRQNGYCELSLSAPLRDCVNALTAN